MTPKVTILSGQEFEDLWVNKLSEEERLDRIRRSLPLVQKVANKQLELLKEIEASPIDKDERFKYLYTTFQNVWQNVEFAMYLGGTPFSQFSFYPARMVLETTFKLEHFARQNKEGQMRIAQFEIMRISKRFYDLEKRTGGDASKYKETYDFFASDTEFPDIDKADEWKLDPFPSMPKLTKASKIEGGENWYFHYQCLAELTHGKLMSIIMREEDAVAEHRRSLMYLQVMCNDLLKNADFHLGGSTRAEVVKAIEDAEKIVKAPL